MRQAYSSRKYRDLIDWIAWNDGTGDDHPIEELAGYLTVTMVAHCYKLKNVQVATDVWNLRRTQD